MREAAIAAEKNGSRRGARQSAPIAARRRPASPF
jgi:hypothetical protein